VHRVLRILTCFAEKESWGLNELARALDLPRGSTHRLLALCRPLGFIAQNESGQYVAGLQLYRLGGKLASQMPINRLAKPLMEAIRDQTNETVMLTVLVRDELMMYFSQVVSPAHPMRYSIECNRLHAIVWGAMGKTLLAYLDEAEIEAALARRDPSPQTGKPLDPAGVRRTLQQVRADGYLITHSERSPDTAALAAPFFDGKGQVLGNIGLAIPEFRFQTHDANRLAAMVMHASAQLSRALS
jgi:DNA-binding IclR family transcriptional regulator